jgi:hypothetical protein
VLLVVSTAGHIPSSQELVIVIERLLGILGIDAGGDIKFGIVVGEEVVIAEPVAEATTLALSGICVSSAELSAHSNGSSRSSFMVIAFPCGLASVDIRELAPRSHVP